MVINPIVGVYIPIIRIPIEGGMTIPKKTRLLTMAQIKVKFGGCGEISKAQLLLFIAWLVPWTVEEDFSGIL